MGRFAERYTEAQRLAVASAQLDNGMTRQQAVKALAAGDLGVDAIDMPIVTAGHFKRRELARRQGRDLHPAVKQGAEQALDRAVSVMVSDLNRAVDRTHRKQRPEAKELQDLATAAKAIRQAMTPPKPKPAGDRSKTPTELAEDQSQANGQNTAHQPSERVRALLTESKRTTNPQPPPHPGPARTGGEQAQQGPSPRPSVAQDVALPPS